MNPLNVNVTTNTKYIYYDPTFIGRTSIKCWKKKGNVEKLLYDILKYLFIYWNGRFIFWVVRPFRFCLIFDVYKNGIE